MKPTVLITTTTRWFPTARLGIAFSKAGCTVDAVCPSGHPLASTTAVRQMHKYSNFTPLLSLARAIAAAEPDLIVPGSDLATYQLHELYQREASRKGRESSTCALIERSLGSPESFPIVYERASFIRLAEQEGVRVPNTAFIQNVAELMRWTTLAGFPVALKADGTSGGEGVRIVSTPDEAESAFQKLQAPPLLARATKRALFDGDRTLLWPSLLRRRSVMSAQKFIVGCDATSTVACWKGSVLAALHFEVVNKRHSTGHATVVRTVENADMVSAVETMIRRLGLSGIHGFDFVLEAQTGNAYLIEINPRTTQVAHLALGAGRDIPAALTAALTGTSVQLAPKVTEQPTIALFPQEWARDPASPFLQSAHHDVPWEEPGLVRACVDRARSQNRSLKQHDWDLAVGRLMHLAPKKSIPAEPSTLSQP